MGDLKNVGFVKYLKSRLTLLKKDEWCDFPKSILTLAITAASSHSDLLVPHVIFMDQQLAPTCRV